MKDYKKPYIEVIEIDLEAHCLGGSVTTSVDSNDPVSGSEEYDQ